MFVAQTDIEVNLATDQVLTIFSFPSTVNKHKPWIETSYHGVITENTEVVLLDPPLVALDKDAPVPYAGMMLHRSRTAPVKSLHL